MVEDNGKIDEKISKSTHVVDRRPHRYHPWGEIFRIRPWEGNYTMLEVRPLKRGGIIRHYTSPRAVIDSALYGTLFSSMNQTDAQMILSIINENSGIEHTMLQEFYFKTIVARMNLDPTKFIHVSRYENGIRITVESNGESKGLFVSVRELPVEEEDEVYTTSEDES